MSLGEEFIKKVYYCELCKLYIPPHDDVEQQLNLHFRDRVHLQLYVQHCEKNKSQEKTAEVVSKECTDEMKSDSNSSNKGAGHEDKHETSDNGDDSSSLNIQHEEKMKNRFDWDLLDAVIGVDKIMPAIAGLSSTPVSTNVKIQSPSKEMESTNENVQSTVIRTEPTKDPSELQLTVGERKRLLNRQKQKRKKARRRAEKLSQAYIPQT
ncbi:unnamed protein product [Macrosiphum euphorbiae]|uniref:Uncharacterized protein n=1 Tax=Macrosiphum euphorbiae TaxID=13131 RepID=A0AAV0XZG4_9HEMI|nr:unnamed protein product [Macrosiphum euphorbiae]